MKSDLRLAVLPPPPREIADDLLLPELSVELTGPHELLQVVGLLPVQHVQHHCVCIQKKAIFFILTLSLLTPNFYTFLPSLSVRNLPPSSPAISCAFCIIFK